ncbi:hypothetical protein [Roseateles violae]|uniref:Uncharacterized protein n=1 Tax=Roseateles violae TaxID=3058042 RepID=A0ABT8DXU9_9BURK|nr:hypothetical protein [Pelomonas sp. PFR6]MDN3922455.1 hypothetical protein [Pelomonas sp. PFR6]
MHRRDALVFAALVLAVSASAQSASAPQADLAAAQGAWSGKLTYRDYSRPDRLVTLPARLFVALSGPSELVFHYVFDDGPSKTVYSYERMTFDFAGNLISWTSGHPGIKTTQNRIMSSQAQDGGRVIVFEREDGETKSRYVLSLHPKALSLGKEESTPSGEFQFRNRYEFSR